MSYRDYFNIDPEYFPQVNNSVMEQNPDLWKKFYPHPSFVAMLNTMVKALKRKEKLGMWVNGAYGTGKSHAVLTLKKLLEASEEETREYFAKYNLDNDLCSELIAQKNEGKIVVAHRYGSSDIENDNDLIVAIQESVEKALENAGIENKASVSMRDSLIEYLSDSENKQSFNIYATGSAKDILGGDMADDVLEKLKTYSDDALRSLIKKLFKVQSVRGNAKRMSPEQCSEWIKEVVEANELKELVLIWDEFSEYIENNLHHLTGFQTIVETTESANFCFMIVTHKAEDYFSDSDPDRKKTIDRFSNPLNRIELPENIAFELMGEAMRITDDPILSANWSTHKNSLDTRTMNSRNAVKNRIHVSDTDLQNVLPIHPYAALILQNISVYYNSTARSMFNFIKNDDGEDIKAFQWFIDNFDFHSTNPFLTVDMLWDFFYDKGKDALAKSIKEVLDTYPKHDEKLLEVEQRVLKVILLLQAISDRMSGNHDIFLPNDKNLTLAFEGTDIEMQAVRIAQKLLRDHQITRTPLTGEVFTYCCIKKDLPVDPGEFINVAKSKSAKDLSFMADSGLRSTIELQGSLKLRFPLSYATVTDFDSEVKKANNPSTASNKLYTVSTIALDDKEASTIKKKIEAFYNDNPNSNVIIIDTSSNTLSESKYDEFVENYATALAIGNGDLAQRKTYEGYAIEVLKGWSKTIKSGPFFIHSRFSKTGYKAVSVADLCLYLLDLDKSFYPNCLEGAYTSVLNTMYDANSLAAGATCGITEETKGTFKSGNEATKLENALKDAWKVEKYWEVTHSYISELKKDVDNLINEAFKKGDRISIAKIYEHLKAEPYGFMPCNITSFIMGFILKEYANGVYSYSDDLTTVPLDSDKLAGMISEVIKLDNTPNARYKDKYIVTLTDEERSFNKATSLAFGIDEKYCVSITDTRSRIRESMKAFSFPIWVINYVLDGMTFKSGEETVSTLIDKFCGIANNKNADGQQSDNDIALSIGKICMENPEAAEDLKSVLTKENCKNGMLEYLKIYNENELPSLAAQIGDGGQYINYLQYKFNNTDAANWVWNKDTINEKIDEQIIEYRIIVESNKILAKNITFRDTISAWLEKIGQIRLSYSMIKNYLGDERDFMDMLYTIKKQNAILDSQKAKFYELLVSNIENFRLFLESQVDLFKKSCSFYFDDLSNDDIDTILSDDKYGFAGSYMKDNSTYTNAVQAAVKTYKDGLGTIQLKKHWKELTDTESPRDWSNKYLMPILAMVPDDELSLARKVFGTINSKNSDSTAISTAEDFITKMAFIPELNSKASRDKAFQKAFLDDYAVLFDDIEKVKEYLKSHVNDEPYYWLGSSDVKAKLNSMAKAKYNASGCDKASKIIDEMSADELKRYLKEIIQDNIHVGIEIMKGRK